MRQWEGGNLGRFDAILDTLRVTITRPAGMSLSPMRFFFSSRSKRIEG